MTETIQLSASRVYTVRIRDWPRYTYIESMSMTDTGWTCHKERALPMSKRAADGIVVKLRRNKLDAEAVLWEGK